MSAVLFHGGRVHIGDGTSAEALLARDGRIVAVGRAQDLAKEAGPAERIAKMYTPSRATPCTR